MFLRTKDPADAPDAPEVVEIEFVDGIPAAVDKEQLAPAKLDRASSTRSPAATAWAGSTSSRTASSA